MPRLPPLVLKAGVLWCHRKQQGQSLTIMAIIHLAAGAAVGAAYGITTAQCSRNNSCGDGFYGPAMMTPSAILGLTGGLFASIGVPMWVVGARQERAAQVGISASANGLRLTF